MAATVCTTAFQMQQLAAIMDTDERRYNAVIAGGPSNFPPYIRLFQAYALGALHGVVDYYLYLDPYGKQPQSIGIFTAIAALEDKMIADSFQFEYTAQSINTLQVLTELRQNLLYRDATGYAHALYLASVGHANALYSAGIGYTQALHGDAVNRATAQYNAAIRYAQGLHGDAVNRATAQYNAAIANSQNLYNRSIGYTNDQVNAARGSIAAVQSQLTALVGADVSSLTKQIADAANKAEQEVKNAVATAESVAGTLAASAGAAAVAKVVTQLQPQISAIKTQTDECLAPLCDTVTPNAKNLGKLGNLLGGATDAALIGLLVAFLVECATNPRQAAGDVTGALGGVVDAASREVRNLVGV